MNIIIVGAGMIGKERLKALELLGENVICIVDPERPQKFDYNPNYATKWADGIEHCYEIEQADWVFICVPHDQVAPVLTNIFAKSKKHINILAEKPLGRDIQEYRYITDHCNCGAKINVGYNYRFYKGVRQLLNDVKDGLFGQLVSVNMVLSLSNAPGSETTWRMDPVKAGRGSILYAGIHLIDLAMLISEDTLKPEHSKSWSGFWNTGIEEEMHIIATDKNNTIYNIQSSVVHWRSTFRIEVNGTEGYGIVEGRNKHYGNQTYIRGKKWGWKSGKSQRDSEEIVVSDYDGEDSFYEETKAVLFGCDGIQPATHRDNRKCLEFINLLNI